LNWIEFNIILRSTKYQIRQDLVLGKLVK